MGAEEKNALVISLKKYEYYHRESITKKKVFPLGRGDGTGSKRSGQLVNLSPKVPGREESEKLLDSRTKGKTVGSGVSQNGKGTLRKKGGHGPKIMGRREADSLDSHWHQRGKLVSKTERRQGGKADQKRKKKKKKRSLGGVAERNPEGPSTRCGGKDVR